MSNSLPLNRREFLERSAAVLAAEAVTGTALSYSRIPGANDRISLAHVGIGNRGTELDLIASKLKSSHNVEMTAVCDLWRVNREKAAATNGGVRGRAAGPERCRWRADLHARTFALADSENGCRGGEGCLCREADGECPGGSESRARRGFTGTNHRPGGH